MVLQPEVLVPFVTDLFKVPPDLDKYEPNEYLHWHIYWCIHLGQEYNKEILAGNAKIISSLSVTQLSMFSLEDYLRSGVQIVFFENTIRESEVNENKLHVNTEEDRDAE